MRILGLSGYHDSGLCVINEGNIEIFLKEERFTRNKRDYTAYRSFLEFIKKNNKPINFISVIDPYINNQFSELLLSRTFDVGRAYYNEDHHLCHASLAFFNSGFEESLIFVIDRNGSNFHHKQHPEIFIRESETVFKANYPCNFETLHKNYWASNSNGGKSYYNYDLALNLKKDKPYTFNVDSSVSIVKIYESATTLINQKALENGKTMGLSSYGEESYCEDFFENGFANDRYFYHGEFIENNDAPFCVLNKKHIGKISNVTKDNYKFYADYAYQVQKQTQKRVLEFVTEWAEKTGINNVCITGGYGLNVVSNENLIKNLPKVNFYFEPLADDTGNSIGAAMHMYRKLSGDKTIHKCQTTFYHGFKPELKLVGKECTTEDIVNQLINQKTVAVFNGLAEAGPRALGNRSILFDARNPNAKDIVNRIKKREWYRPFAGMILEEYFEEYFETHGWKKSEFMTVSFNAKKPEKMSGIIHVDNSCRIQTVNNDIPHIRQLLEQFMEKTGCPSLLNTSFNLAGEPLIETQKEAIECFEDSEIDVLWFPEIKRFLKKN